MVSLISRSSNFSIKHFRRSDSLLPVGVLSGVYFLAIAPLDPDLHHDGVQYAAAAGVADGLHIHSQIFEQYGPITAWVQGWTLDLFGFNLLNLRIENALIFTLVSILMMKVLLTLRIPVIASSLVTIAWVLSCPVTSIPRVNYGYNLWPWPNSICLVLLLLISILFLKSVTEKRVLSTNALLFIGSASALLIFTRIQVGILATFSSILLITFGLGIENTTARIKKLNGFFIGFIGSTALVLLVLIKQDALQSFISQVITGSLNQYGNAFNWGFYRQFYFYGSLPFLALFIFTVVIWRRNHSLLRWIALSIVPLAIHFTILLGNTRFVNFSLSSREAKYTFDLLPMTFLYASALWGFGVVIFSIGVSAKWIVSKLYARKTQEAKIQVVDQSKLIQSKLSILRNKKITGDRSLLYFYLGILALPFASQIYPMADQIHLWWGASLLVILIPVTLQDLVSARGINSILASILVPLIISTAFTFNNYRVIPRSLVFDQTNAFAGMKVRINYLSPFATIGGLLDGLEPKSAHFECPDGLLSAWTGHYLSIDANYVSWAWGTDSDHDRKVAAKYFLCSSPEGATAFALANDVKIIEPGISYSFGIYSSGYIYEYVPNSK